ncbi:guanylate kinase [bacterium]|nr:guanylate kinase [bacterium]
MSGTNRPIVRPVYPILFCFCGPTASGKSTITESILNRAKHLRKSISTTTRSPRPGEVDGRDYYFVSTTEFEARRRANQFIENAIYSGNQYGTERRNIEEALRDHVDLIFNIEIEGVTALKNLYPGQVVTVFVFPPSFQELEDRLNRRGAETEEEMKLRIDTAHHEVEVLSDAKFSDYFLVNNTLDHAIDRGLAIVEAERIAVRHIGADFFKQLQRS